MAFNGSGTFNRLYSWVQDKANGIFVTASRMDAEMDGMATGLSTCITRDGQSAPTANIPMGAFKITGLAAGVSATDAVNVGQVPTLAGAGVFYNVGNSGVAVTISWANGTMQQITLTANTTITIGNGVNPGWYTLRLIQDATGGRTVAFVGAGYTNGNWIGHGNVPLMDPVAATENIIYLFWDGGSFRLYYFGAVARRDNYITSVYRATSNQTTVANASTKIQFNAVDLDPYSEWDTVTNFRWTPTVTGLYLVQVNVACTNASASTLDVQLFQGGSTIGDNYIANAVALTAYNIRLTQVVPVSVLATGYLEAKFTSVTGAGTIIFGQSSTSMSITRLGDIQ